MTYRTMRRLVPVVLVVALAHLPLGGASATPPLCDGSYAQPRVSLNGSSSFVDLRRPAHIWLGGYLWHGDCTIPGQTVGLYVKDSFANYRRIADAVTGPTGSYTFGHRPVAKTSDFLTVFSGSPGHMSVVSQRWHVTVTSKPTWAESCTPSPDVRRLPAFSFGPDVDIARDESGEPTIRNNGDTALDFTVDAAIASLRHVSNGEQFGIYATRLAMTRESFPVKPPFRMVVEPGQTLFMRMNDSSRRCQGPTFGQALNAGDYLLDTIVKMHLNGGVACGCGWVSWPPLEWTLSGR